MLTLLTALALNIPGNPTKFECLPLVGHKNECIVFSNNIPAPIPMYRIKLKCDADVAVMPNKYGEMFVYPKQGIVEGGSVTTLSKDYVFMAYACSIASIKNL